MATGEYTKFTSDLSLYVYFNYVFMGFGLLVAFGLLFRFKLARGIILLSSYVLLLLLFINLVNYQIIGELSWYLIIGSLSFHILQIYLLSHKDIIDVFKVKHPKGETISYVFLSAIVCAFFLWNIQSSTSEVSNISGEVIVDE
jgi:hypothetical protein